MRSLLLFILVISAFGSQAQMCPCEFGKSGKVRRHELGISLLSSIGEPGTYRAFEKAIMPAYASGINYKYHLDKFSLRAQAAYKYYPINDVQEMPPLSPETTDGKAAFTEIRAGIEKTIIPGKWRLYIGLDLLYGNGSSSGSQFRYTDVNQQYKASVNYIGASVLPGLNFRAGERLSFNFEPCINMSRNVQTQNSASKTYNRTYVLLNTLSVNYHF